jgi:hypothetical protein
MAANRSSSNLLTFAVAATATALTFLYAPPIASATDADAPIEAFFGTYVGGARIQGETTLRDLIVSIGPTRKGFSIYTSTVIRASSQRAAPGVKWRSETQKFLQTDVDHLYEPMLRESMFARRRDPDMMAGDTLAWASIRGRTLGVFAMNVLEDGHYELRVFERTLTDLGMDLKFTRYRDGEVVRELTGTLARANEGDESDLTGYPAPR